MYRDDWSLHIEIELHSTLMEWFLTHFNLSVNYKIKSYFILRIKLIKNRSNN